MLKGAHELIATLVIIAFLLAAFLFLTGTASGQLLAGKSLFRSRVTEPIIENVPCYEGPRVSFAAPKIFFIDVDANDGRNLAQGGVSSLLGQAEINLDMVSACKEPISMIWNYGNATDGSEREKELCIFDGTRYVDNATREECGTRTVPYIFDELSKSFGVRLEITGQKSRLTGGDLSTVFVKDPNLEIAIEEIDTAGSCTRLQARVHDSYYPRPNIVPNLEKTAFRVFDNRNAEFVEKSVTAVSGQRYVLFYRPTSESQQQHNVILQASPKLQTVEDASTFTPSGLDRDEFVVYGEPADLDIFGIAFGVSGFSYILTGEHFPDLPLFDRAVEVFDFDNDGVEEIATLMTPGDLFVMEARKLEAEMRSPSFNSIDLEDMQRLFPYFNVQPDISWVALAAGNNIKTAAGTNVPTAIVTLGGSENEGTGDINLYSYEAGRIVEIKTVPELPNVDWEDVATADFDDDGEDEIIVLTNEPLRTMIWFPFSKANDLDLIVDPDTGTPLLYIFKSGFCDDCGEQDLESIFGRNINWQGIAAGDIDLNGMTDIVMLGTPGDITVWEYDEQQKEFFTKIGLNPSLPNAAWRDVDIINADSDPELEVVIVKNDEFCVFNDISLIGTGFSDNMDNLRNTPGVICTDLRWVGAEAWSIAGGDVFCDEGDFNDNP